jgi:DNA-binding NarL/FixJ family response regulator
VLIADDHEWSRHRVGALADNHADWEVSVATSGRDALKLSRRIGPDVVIVDVPTAHTAALALIRLLGQDAPGARVLLVTSRDDDDSILDALTAGARGYVLSTDSLEHIEAAVAALGAGRLYFCPRISALLLDKGARGLAPG